MHLDKGYNSHLTIERCHTLGVRDVVCAKKRKAAPKATKRRRRAEPRTTNPSTGEPNKLANGTAQQKKPHTL